MKETAVVLALQVGAHAALKALGAGKWRKTFRAFLACPLVTLMLFSLVAPATAHDVPGEMRVHAFIQPEGERLHVLLRIPLDLLLNLNLPKRGPGYLDLAQIDEGLVRAIAATDKDIELFEDGRRLRLERGDARISMPSDRSFESIESARALMRGPRLPVTEYVFWNQGYFDAYLEYPIHSTRSSFALDFHITPGLRDRLKLDLRYISSERVIRAYEISTGSGLLVLDPRWYEAAWSFVKSGFEHILDGPDHLLFLLCLIIPFRKVDWYLVGVVTSFTVAHSITLIAAAYGFVPAGAWFPPLIEMLIAASIVYLAIENIVRPNLRQRWVISGLFGLVHGFGFSFMLQTQLQFAGSHLLLSLLAFNVGIELGQLLVLVVTVPALVFLYRTRVLSEQLIAIIVGVLVAHTAWHWMSERANALRKVDWSMLEIGLANFLLLLAFSVLLIGGTYWLFLRRRTAKKLIKDEGVTNDETSPPSSIIAR